jgi:exodeoxyribonuclease VII large subunit
MSQSFLEGLFTEPKPLTISQLTARIKQRLESDFAIVLVEGEISNYTKHSSGHWYFTLKDSGAQIGACCFKTANRYIKFRVENGMAVRVRGRISVYEPQGKYQIVAETIEPVGVGALQLAFEQLKRKLELEGLFDQARKRPLPLLPRRVGVVTSSTGAAIRDILNILKRRNKSVHVLIAPVKVQGEGAAREIVEAIRFLNRCDDIDVLIVGRGGGSLEDLWSFNEEIVARAIHASAIPVISAVGHEIDFTIADFVADLRAPTPSAAAEIVAAAREELDARLRALNADLVRAMEYKLISQRSRVTELQTSRGFLAARDQVYQLNQRLDYARNRIEGAIRTKLVQDRNRWHSAALNLNAVSVGELHARAVGRLRLVENRLQAATRSRLDSLGQRFHLAVGKLNALSPLTVLNRGYALIRNEKGQLIKKPDDTHLGERLQVKLSQGEITVIRE